MRVETFAFRVNQNERRAIADLATRLQRTQSDAVRFVVIEAAKQLTQARADDHEQSETTAKGETYAVTV